MFKNLPAPMTMFAAAVAAAVLLSYVLAPISAWLATRAGALDIPNARKVHSTPVPRLGGLAVVAATALVWAGSSVLFDGGLPPVLSIGLGLGVLPILAVSVLDDIRAVPAGRKLLAQVIGAAIAVACGVSLGPQVHLFDTSIHLGILAVPLSMLWLVGITNAFNIIDGLDGLSAGLALISAVSMAVVFGLTGQPVMAGATLVIAGALAGFLPYNMHPARLFLGDSGATAVGFCLGAFALEGGSTLSSGFAVLVPVFILGLPLADTLIAIARRTVNRLERRTGGVFVPDRNHIHHRLLALGVEHPKAVLILYGAGVAFAAVAFGSMFLKARHAALFLIGLFVAGAIGIHRLGYDEFAFIRRGIVLRVYEAPVFRRALFVVFADLAMAVLAAYMAVGLKQDGWSLQANAEALTELSGLIVPFTAVVFWKTGLYRGGWRLAGVADLARAGGATTAVAVLAWGAHSVMAPATQPASLFVIYALVSLFIVVTSRASYVLLLTSQRRASSQGRPVLIYGAGSRGVAASRELYEKPEAGFRPVGFVDDDPEKAGNIVNGLPVVGSSVDLGSLISKHGIDAVLVAADRLPPEAVSRAARICERAGISLFRLRVELQVLMDASAVKPTSPPESVENVDGAGAPFSLVGAQPCRACGGTNVHRSHARTTWERFRKSHNDKRLYRCNDCGWRGWLTPLEFGVAPVASPPDPDLRAIDDAALAIVGGSALSRRNVS